MGTRFLHVIGRGSVTGVWYRDEILEPYVCLSKGGSGADFILMNENTCPHIAHLNLSPNFWKVEIFAGGICPIPTPYRVCLERFLGWSNCNSLFSSQNPPGLQEDWTIDAIRSHYWSYYWHLLRSHYWLSTVSLIMNRIQIRIEKYYKNNKWQKQQHLFHIWYQSDR